MNQPEILSFLQEEMRAGRMTAGQANVEKVRIQRVQLVTNRLPADVRKALNDGVKARLLAHLPRDGYRPEAYYHPTFDYLARGARAKHAENQIKQLKAVAGIAFA